MSNNTEMIHNNMDPTITCHSPKMEKLKQSLHIHHSAQCRGSPR